MTAKTFIPHGKGRYNGEDRASTAARHIKGPPELTEDPPAQTPGCPPASQRGPARGPLRTGKKPAGK
jgi:hypothetical protein